MTSIVERRKGKRDVGIAEEDDEPRLCNGTSGYVSLLLSLAAGLGGFLFGYDTGVISGALLFIRDDFESVQKSSFLQEAIVSTAILGAVLGAIIGGRTSDQLGRKVTILAADIAFATGSLLMAIASNPYILLAGRFVVGLGIGVVSITAPLYIAEVSSSDKRGALVSLHVLMITTGQFLSYVVNYFFTKVPGTWRWMLGIAAVPAVLQAIIFIWLPESPHWLVSQRKYSEAMTILTSIHPVDVASHQLEEVLATKEANEHQIKEDNQGIFYFLRSKETRLALTGGVGLQIFQQLIGINTVMYYSPSIVQQAGFASPQTALLLSSGIAGVNALGTIVGILLIDRVGRRKLALTSLLGVIASWGLLSLAFHLASLEAPLIEWPLDAAESSLVCPIFPTYESLQGANCIECLQAGCGFCGTQVGKGTCLIFNSSAANTCTQNSRSFFQYGCPSHYGLLALLGLVSYIMAFAPGMGPVPWAVNSEIYPSTVRGSCAGIAATSNWVSNFLVAQTFLTMIDLLGTSGTFLIFTFISILAFVFVALAVPETKGLSLEEVRHLWEITVESGGIAGNWMRGRWVNTAT